MESEYIAWLTAEVQRRHRHVPYANVPLGIGDDAAIIQTSSQTVCCADLLAEGTHFVLRESVDLERVGRKSLAVNLSDMAAMGARPESAMLSLLVNREHGLQQAQGVTRGLLELADEFQVALVGGDTCSWTGGLVVNVSVTGTLLQSHPLLRSGARPGDTVLVTGSLGGSIQKQHWAFTPRCHAIAQILPRFPIHSATDISDGLVRDLGHVIDASSVGARLFAEQIPVSAAAFHLAATANDNRERRQQDCQRLGISPALWNALYDGEDFELLLTMPPEPATRLLEEVRRQSLDLGCSLTQIGEITESASGLTIIGSTGEVALPMGGYQH